MASSFLLPNLYLILDVLVRCSFSKHHFSTSQIYTCGIVVPVKNASIPLPRVSHFKSSFVLALMFVYLFNSPSPLALSLSLSLSLSLFLSLSLHTYMLLSLHLTPLFISICLSHHPSLSDTQIIGYHSFNFAFRPEQLCKVFGLSLSYSIYLLSLSYLSLMYLFPVGAAKHTRVRCTREGCPRGHGEHVGIAVREVGEDVLVFPHLCYRDEV